MRLLRPCIAALLALAPLTCLPQAYPAKPVRIVEGFPPGSPMDIIMRTASQWFRQSTGQVLVVENRPGAAGHVATQEVARAAADGYTLLTGADTQLTVNPHLFTKTGMEVGGKLVPVALLTKDVMAVACDPRLPAKTIPQMFELSKTRSLTFGSSGPGSPAHVTMEMLLRAAGVSMTHVPYRGPAAVVTALLGKEIDCAIGVSSTLLPFWRDRKIEVIAVSGTEPNPRFPGIPSFAELGYRNESPVFYGILAAPQGTPAPVLQLLQREFRRIMNEPQVRETLLRADIDPIFVDQAAAQKIINDQSERFRKAIAEIGLKVE